MAGGNAVLPIQFFKIILPTNLQRIKIPRMFTRRYRFGPSNPMFLNPPDGTKWKVHLKKRKNGEVWLEKGWKEFTQNYSLQCGCLVVFKYEGGEGTSKHFEVLILHKNGLEIDYPSCKSDNNTIDEKNILDESDDDKSVEIFDECPNPKNRQKPVLVSPRPRKKVRGVIENEKEKKTSKMTSSSLKYCSRGARAQQVAQNFISSNPFFTVSIKPGNLAGYQMSLPNLEGVIEITEAKYVVLQSGKRSWNVKLFPSQKPRGGSSRFSAGWSLFATENRLKPGDVCVFELINREDSVFKVYVF